jgi:hypothetical protein
MGPDLDLFRLEDPDQCRVDTKSMLWIRDPALYFFDGRTRDPESFFFRILNPIQSLITIYKLIQSFLGTYCYLALHRQHWTTLVQIPPRQCEKTLVKRGWGPLFHGGSPIPLKISRKKEGVIKKA